MRLMLGSDPAPAQAAGTVPDSRFESATFLRQVVVGEDESTCVHWQLQPSVFSWISQSQSPTAGQCKAPASQPGQAREGPWSAPARWQGACAQQGAQVSEGLVWVSPRATQMMGTRWLV